MGNVTAKFAADFTDFDKNVTAADAKLGTFGSSTAKAGDALSHLSTNATSNVGPFNSMRDSLNQFDGALGAVGIHIGPEVRALGELSDASGKSAKDLGLLGTAGLVTAAALGGWKLGRMVAEFFGLDTAIANSTAKLLGWGDVVAATAGAKADVLARATATAKREITDYSEAIRINYDALQKRTAVIVAGNATEKAAAEARAAFMKKAYAEEQAAADKMAAIQDHLFGRDLISKATEYSRALGDVSNVSKLMPASMVEMNKAFTAALAALSAAGQGASASAAQFRALQLATTDWAAINAQLAAMPDPFAKNRADRMAAMRDTGMALMNENQGLTDNARYWAHAGEIADESMKQAADAVKSVVPPTRDTANGIRSEFVAAFQSASGAADFMAAHVASVLGALTQTDAYRKAGFFVNEGFGTAGTINRNALASIGRTVPGFAQGGSGDFGTGTLAMLHGKESIVPWGQGGGGPTVTVHITVNGSVLSNPQELARVVGDAFMTRLRAAGVRLASGV